MIPAIAKNILDIDGIVGIGHGSSIKVYVESEEYVDAVPKAIAGKPVEVRVVGRVKALGIELLRSEVEPVVGGVEITNDICECVGTLGIVHGGKLYTNAHVIAMDANANFVQEAVPVYQPYGGRRIATLEKYYPIEFNDQAAENYIDIAVADMEVEAVEDTVMSSDGELYSIEWGYVEPKSGSWVRKTGRTTGTTHGVVDSVSTSVKVWYGDKWAVFHDTIAVLTEGFCAAGDSGSVVDYNGRLVGFLFAGSEYGYGFVCKAKYLEVRATAVEVGTSLLPIAATAGLFALAALSR